MIKQFSIYSIIFSFLALISVQKIHAKEGSGSSSAIISIPVRFNVFVGLQNGTSSYNADKKDISVFSYLGGIDFNVPIPFINSLIGINAWYMASGKTGNTISSSFLFLGPYVGYSSGRVDIFAGGGISPLVSDFSDDEAVSGKNYSLYKTSGCGIAGFRVYLGKSLSTGFGITGYTCQANDYTKNVNSTTDTKTTVSDKVSASGGILYFMYAWNEQRTLL